MKHSIALGMGIVALAACSGQEAPPVDGDVAEVAQELIIPCSPEDDSRCRKRTTPMICDYNQGYCVFVCDDGEACPTHRPCCN